MSDVEVEALDPDDWRRWRAIRLASLEQDPAAFGSSLADWTGAGDTEERWRSRWRGVPHTLVAVLDGADVGVVGLWVQPGNPAVEMVSTWVDPTARGRGVGDGLVDAVLALAAERHPGREVQLSVYQDNEPARRLYARHGFVDVGSSPDDPRELRMAYGGPRPSGPDERGAVLVLRYARPT